MSDTETAEQKIIVSWFRCQYPEYRRSLRVSLAGINFGSGARGGRMKNHVRACGVELGESDLVIAIPRGDYGSLVLEHKAAAMAKYGASDEQIEYVDYHNSIGNCAVITRGVDAAKAAIRVYMELGEHRGTI